MTEDPPVDLDPARVLGRSIGRTGLRVFLASLAMLLAGAVVAFVVVRLEAPEWPPAGAPPLPRGLWASTATLLAASWAVHRAVVAVRAGRQATLRRSLALASGLGVLFVVLQAANWAVMLGHGLSARSSLYGFTFYLLTGLHAVHLVGGLVPLGVVTAHSRSGRYTQARPDGVELVAEYWHFLDGAWVVMFAALLIAS